MLSHVNQYLLPHYYDYIVQIDVLFILHSPFRSILIGINSIEFYLLKVGNPVHLFGVFKLTYNDTKWKRKIIRYSVFENLWESIQCYPS